MPIFEFDCKSCEAPFETLVRSQSQEVKCPSCGSEDVTKRFSAFASKTAGSSAPASGPRPSGGGCGPSCGCHH